MKAVKESLGGTVNDVVLAVTSGAARRHLRREGVDLGDVESLRALLPVHTGGSERHGAENHVAMLLADLPVDEVNPLDRMRHVVEDTSDLKDDSHQVEGARLIEELSDVTTRHLLTSAFKLATRAGAFDMVITNVRGPSFPLYLLGARMRNVYPVVPLFSNQNLGIALFSYDGSIHWGFNADWDSFPAVTRFVEDLEASFEELKGAAHRHELAKLRGKGPNHPASPSPARSGA